MKLLFKILITVQRYIDSGDEKMIKNKKRIFSGGILICILASIILGSFIIKNNNKEY